MSNKQSNKQTQNVKVIVNNKMPCCDKPKPKKRKQQRKPPQEEEPMDEFPPLYTPPARNGLMNMAPMANRNSVYIPPTIQISNTSQPVPAYFDKFYTNMTRTMEDIASMIRKEQQDVKYLIGTDTQTDIADPTSAVSPKAKDSFNNPLFSTPQITPQPTMTPPREATSSLTQGEATPTAQDEDLASTSRTPVKQLTKVFEPVYEEDNTEPYIPINEEEQIIPTSPEHSVLIKKYEQLYRDWEKAPKYSNERKDVFDKIKTFATELELNLNNPNGKPRTAPQLRSDIRKAIAMYQQT